MSMADFWDCSLWEFSAAVAGWNKAQSGDGDKPAAMTPQRYDELLELHGYR
jgi:hypothetical protein